MNDEINIGLQNNSGGVPEALGCAGAYEETWDVFQFLNEGGVVLCSVTFEISCTWCDDPTNNDGG